MAYKLHHRMYNLLGGNNDPYVEDQILQVLNRFGISMGVGDKTIEEVCTEQNIDGQTLLTIVNYTISRELPDDVEVDIPTLNRYLENAHAYFLNFQLPRIRQELLQTLNLAHTGAKLPLMILQFFDEYVQEIRTHIEHEKQHSYEQHPRDDEHVAIKARELRGLIIKYYPGEAMSSGDTAMSGQMQMLYTVLHDLHHFEQELALHCAIEDNIMLPALRKQQESMARKRDVVGFGEAEELSAREVEILKHIAQGRSNKEIADILCLSTHTVMSHRKNIARKLDIHSTAGLTIYAVVNGIVTL